MNTRLKDLRHRATIISLAAGVAVYAATFALAEVFVPVWRQETRVPLLLVLTTLLLVGARWAVAVAPRKIIRQMMPPLVGLLGAAWFTLTSFGSPQFTYIRFPNANSFTQISYLAGLVPPMFRYGAAPLPADPTNYFAVVSLTLLVLVLTDLVAHSRFPLLAGIFPLLFWVPALGLGFGVPRSALVATVTALLLLVAATNPTRQAGSSVRLSWKPILLGIVAGAVAITPSIGASYFAGFGFTPRRFFPTNSIIAIGGIGGIGTGNFGNRLGTDQPLAQRSDEPLFTYVTSTGQDVGLLRFATFSNFDGQEWTTFSPQFGYSKHYAIAKDGVRREEYSDSLDDFSTVVIFTVNNMTGRTLPLVGNERSIRIDPTGNSGFEGDFYDWFRFGNQVSNTWNFDAANDVAISLQPLPVGAQIRMALDPNPTNAETLRTALPGMPLMTGSLTTVANVNDTQLLQLALPAADEAYLIATAQNLIAGAPTYYDAAVAIQDYLRNSGGFTYSTDPPVGDNSNVVLDFLAYRQGYCVHFASTMVALSRAIGIPARLAVGFQPGTQNENGEWVVTSQDSHSWAELYFGPGVGWVTFDPTAPVSPGSGSHADTSAQGQANLEDEELLNEWARRYSNLGGNAAASSGNANHAANSGGVGGDRTWLLPVVLGGLAAVALAVLAVQRRRVRQQQRSSGMEEFALLQATNLLRRRGVPISAGCTPRQLPQAAVMGWQAKYRSDPPPNLVSHLEKITVAAEQARYADCNNTLSQPDVDLMLKQIKKARPVSVARR